MTRRVAALVLWLGGVLWPSVAFAADYVLVLRDGRRLEVRDEYRIVNEVAVFTTLDGRRISIALANIDIPATERVNGLRDGEFRAQAQPPRPIGAREDAQPPVAATPPAASPKPAPKAAQKPMRTLTNADFGRTVYRTAERPVTSAKMSSEREQTTPSASSSDAALANNEAYWRGRARNLLTEIYAQQEIIRMLSNQAQGLQRRIEQQGKTFLVGRDLIGNRVLLPHEVMTPEKQELINVNERIREAQTRLTGLYVQYTVLQEEARRLGVPPGWLR